jgi:hypothetical protein
VATIAVRLVGCTEPAFHWRELGARVRTEGDEARTLNGINRPCRPSR